MRFPGQALVGEEFEIPVRIEPARSYRMPLNDEGTGIGPPTAVLSSSKREPFPLALQLNAVGLEVVDAGPRVVDEDRLTTWRVTAHEAGEKTVQLVLDNLQTQIAIGKSESGFREFSDSHGMFDAPLVVTIPVAHPNCNVRNAVAIGLSAVGLTCAFGSIALRKRR